MRDTDTEERRGGGLSASNELLQREMSQHIRHSLSALHTVLTLRPRCQRCIILPSFKHADSQLSLQFRALIMYFHHYLHIKYTEIKPVLSEFSITLSMRKLNLSCHTSNQNKAKMSYSCERLLFQGFDACIPYGREK